MNLRSSQSTEASLVLSPYVIFFHQNQDRIKLNKSKATESYSSMMASSTNTQNVLNIVLETLS